MQVFKTDKKLFWTNSLKSWLWTWAFAALLYFGLKQLFSITNDNFIAGFIVILLLKISDTLTQYHVKEIQIDEQEKQLTFLLNNFMLGEKTKRYELGLATSELIKNSGLTKYFSPPFTLKIFLRPKDTFIISNRYGFTLATLASVDRTLKSLETQS